MLDKAGEWLAILNVPYETKQFEMVQTKRKRPVPRAALGYSWQLKN